MSKTSLTLQGNLLQDLLGYWKKEFPKRAAGGWWALSGFALQTSVYLFRFFQQVEKAAEPGLLAEMEHLSDILCPADGKLTLIQVKRTLTRHALISAVEEAYLITDLCRRHTPPLLDHLRFQIACRERVTAAEVTDLSMPEVVGANGDTASWDLMIGCFDPIVPITEEPDALDQLYTLLWNAGIKNAHSLIQRCVGKLLMNFGTSSPEAVRHVGRELADYFFAAERHKEWEPSGNLLSIRDVTSDSKLAEYTGVLTGQQPRLEHLAKGFFRDRPHIFHELWGTFTRWVLSLGHVEREVDDKVPVFWISGRSGEGKSVLLIQLVAEALRLGIVSPLLQMQGGDDLPRLVASAPDRGQFTDRGFGRIFAVVDDVYDLHRHGRDEWDAIILDQCDYRPPLVAIITCGPTEQKEQFESRLSGQFEVTSFKVPTLSVEECRAFLTWYESRTGQAREWSELTIENPLLVQLMFELAHGERMPEFARRFKKRLIDMNVFDVARAILAVNALYLDAPFTLIANDQNRDALEYLCQDEQLHFRVTLAGGGMAPAGVRFAHAHIAWLLFIEWVDPSPTTLAKAWARELIRSLSLLESGPNPRMATTVLSKLLQTQRLSDDGSLDSGPPTANRGEVIGELYRLHTVRWGGRPSQSTLPMWLELEYRIPELQLVPDPAEIALSDLSDAALAPHVSSSVGTKLWSLSESRPLLEAERMRTAVRNFFLRYPDVPGVAFALAGLLGNRRNDQSVRPLVVEWLTRNPTNPQAYDLIATLVAANPNDVILRGVADSWLNANEAHPHTSRVIAPLVAANPNDAKARGLAFNWLAANETHPQAYWLARALVAANPNDTDVRRLATGLLAANEAHPEAHQLIASLVAAHPNDADVRGMAVGWLAANDAHPQAYQLIAPLVAANPDDVDVRRLAIRWLDANDTHSQAYQLIAPLVAANPNDAEAKGRALSWLANNETHPQAYWLVAPLLAANPNDAKAKGLALSWLASNETHPQACWLVAVLVAGSPNDVEILKFAAAWLAAHEADAGYSELLKVVIARSDGAKEWLEHGEKYARKPDAIHPETILGVLLTAGKADPKFIEMAFDFIETTDNAPRGSILYHLRRALVRNFHNAAAYLNGTYDEQRKKTVCASIALGMKRFPDTIASFALEVVPQLEANHTYHILRNVIARHLEYDYLDEMVAQWLIDNYRRRGYGGMLKALQKNPGFWERLLSLEELPKRIVDDFDALISQ